ncbi:MATH domain-containing protein [Prochlorococcus marinus]|uniref:MATH domain-containing protein n=1 Tax=Prochlorococcus marinus TaxID=1219 RepID=UPI0022B3D207|nr:MATH domain-containing protein [Prochlorococcus marinus]
MILNVITLKKIYLYELNNNQFSKNAISHKELNDFLIKAQKDITSRNSSEYKRIKEEQDFNDLIKNWTETSQKILLMMNKKEELLTKNKNSKSLIAFGAMGAHINMALQALKATGSS